MSMSVGASSNALSYLQQLLQQGTAGASSAASASDPLSILLQDISGSGGSTATSSSTAPAGSGSSGCSPFGNGTMAALISLQGQSASGTVAQSPSDLFSKLDTDGDGKISKSEFETALGSAGVSTANADQLFSKLDANGDTSISQSELTSAKHAHGHHHAHGGGGGGDKDAASGQNPLDALLSGAGADGATTQSATNADGSTTTTISYADGTKIDMTTPAAQASNTTSSSASSTQSGANNLLEQLIKLQSQMLSVATSTLSAIA